ncbi:hypothetical protein CcI49_02800 [Frankia sp. CcI49]|uniref:hypothetical protein n=1 Tax=Frankia sp. CcI49 TaxID=1745382 RepID=UPI000975EECB|nr:hypothetical protein [Frankia sp. CcI49]ONH62323.1 hypothetical protein CcI49_02800 [Frankia sp. CcI49]
MSTLRYAGDLGELLHRPNLEWSPGAMGTYLRELHLRDADKAAEKAQRLIASGASHQQIMDALAAAEYHSRRYPEDQREHRAVTDAYASEHSLRGWHRREEVLGKALTETRIFVNYIRTPECGDRGRYRIHDPGWRISDGSRVWVVDDDTGKAVARFGFEGPVETARAEAEAWISAAGDR